MGHLNSLTIFSLYFGVDSHLLPLPWSITTPISFSHQPLLLIILTNGHQNVYFSNPSKKQWSPPQTSISCGTIKISQVMHLTNLRYDSTNPYQLLWALFKRKGKKLNLWKGNLGEIILLPGQTQTQIKIKKREVSGKLTKLKSWNFKRKLKSLPN